MQKFSYHTHTNNFGIFDGHHSAEEMINQAAAIGYTELGISNHLVYHPNLSTLHPMFFNDYNKLEDVMLRTADAIREAADKAPIKVYLGFEVDFFPSAMWRDAFEKLRQKLNADYYIGSFHSLRSEDETKIDNMYTLKMSGTEYSDEEITAAIHIYWQNVSAAAESGYFDFIAHPDVYKIFPRFATLDEDKDKWSFIETLARLKQPFELNTSGWFKCGEQHPYTWMLKELQKRDVPVVISDDAHDVCQLGKYYEEAENLLSSLNYTNRWKLER